MPTFKIAHLNEGGQNMIIIPVDSDFGAKSNFEQQRTMDEFQARARSAGLAGHVVLVWDAGGGRMGFRAPNAWHSFFQGVNLAWVWANINRNLFW